MTIESIQNLRTKARSGKDPDARKQLDEYIEENEKLDLTLREKEKDRGAIKEREDFKLAKHMRDTEAAQEIVYEYARGVRERRARWREEKIKDDNKKKEA
eukprot:5529687-Amphidinium_carterae.1